MIHISFPDGNTKSYTPETTVADIAKSISSGLARNLLSATLNGETIAPESPVKVSGAIQFFTWDDPEGKQAFWHSSAHLLAQALVHFYPHLKLTIGPAIKNGFYYDVDLQGASFSEKDFEKVEKRMVETARGKHPFTVYPVSYEEALEKYTTEKNPYKVELIEGLSGQAITFCRHDDFVDLCRGGHVPHTGFIKAVKIMSVAGAYWRADASKNQLTRIYGVSFPKQTVLKDYLEKLELAKERDHRKIGKNLELFAFSQKVGVGLPLWLPKGTEIKYRLETFMRTLQKEMGYEMVSTPHIAQKQLYETSGHYQKYGQDSFQPIQTPNQEEEFMLKPMNCPHHCEIYKTKQRSYRDLPVRYAEFGTVYRYEQSGELNGLTRVRGFTQDDAHIFCTQEQVKAEFKKVIDLVISVFLKLGFNDYKAQISLRSLDDHSKYIGSDAHWEKSEAAIVEACEEKGLKAQKVYGEAAFYGPKLDFMIRDVMDREWQLGTIQVDYNLPDRFGLEYTDEKNQSQTPVMIHRAPFGSLERFIAILLEHTGGLLPLWIHPEPLRILPVSDKFIPYAEKVKETLRSTGLTVFIDGRNEKVSRKVRDAEVQKVMYMCIVGEREERDQSVSLRKHREQEQGSVSLIELSVKINKELKNV